MNKEGNFLVTVRVLHQTLQGWPQRSRLEEVFLARPLQLRNVAAALCIALAMSQANIVISGLSTLGPRHDVVDRRGVGRTREGVGVDLVIADPTDPSVAFGQSFEFHTPIQVAEQDFCFLKSAYLVADSSKVQTSPARRKVRLPALLAVLRSVLVALLTIFMAVPAALTFRPNEATAAGDPANGLLAYSLPSNTQVQTQAYSGPTNSFAPPESFETGRANLRFQQLKTAPSKREALFGVTDNTGKDISISCFDGNTWTSEFAVPYTGSSTAGCDLAYETQSGDALVVYSRLVSGANEMAYRTKPGNLGCGSANWSPETLLDSTSLINDSVRWIKMASDPRTSSSNIALSFESNNKSLSAMHWNGSSFVNESPLLGNQSLSTINVGYPDLDPFDIVYESLSGDVMLAWGDASGGDGINGVRYVTCEGGVANCSWSAVITPPAFADDAASLDLAANPQSNEIVFASAGRAASDLQAGYWSGSSWTNTADVDTTMIGPSAYYQSVAAVWLTNGSVSRSVIYYRDTDNAVNYVVGNGGSFVVQTDFPGAGFGSVLNATFSLDPISRDRGTLILVDSGLRMAAKRAVLDSSGVVTWTNSDGGTSISTNMQGASNRSFAFAYWNVLFNEVAITGTVNPTLSFTVAGRATACNGLSLTAGSASTANTVNVGRANAGLNVVAAQDLTAASNAASGFAIYLRYNGQLTGPSGSITDLAATNATPSAFSAPGTNAFGYTTSDATLIGGTANRFTSPSAQWAGLTTSDQPVSSSTAVGVVDTNCVAFQVGTAANAASGTYATTVFYNAVPTF